MICNECETVAHCTNHGCIPKQPAQDQCRTDGRCQYAIDSGAEGMGHCPKGKCIMPAQPQQEPVAWKLMPRKATDEMLKAMDECSTEGYDERLYAGHASSVYMAAWDSLTEVKHELNCVCGAIWEGDELVCTPHPSASKPWVGLTDEEILSIARDHYNPHQRPEISFARAIEAKLKEKNT